MTRPRLQTVYLVSSAAPELAAFYQEALALDFRFADGGKWVQLSDGTTNFAVASPEEAPDGHTAPTMVFRVDDLADARSRITAGGGVETGFRDMESHGQVATFRDPEGNVFQLHPTFSK